MIIASGFLEADSLNEVDSVRDELRQRDVEVNDVKDDRIVFLIERETEGEVKRELESLKDIGGVRNVYLSYFSIEGSDEVPKGEA